MNIAQQILQDLRIELTEKFDRNFSQGGFFGKTWPALKNGEPTHLNNTGTLRRSIRSTATANTLTFTSATPYARIHNQGGTITVTKKMKAYFWAMYKKTGQRRYKAMALMKPGAKIRIPQRQFLAPYLGIEKTVQRSARRALELEVKKTINQMK